MRWGWVSPALLIIASIALSFSIGTGFPAADDGYEEISDVFSTAPAAAIDDDLVPSLVPVASRSHESLPAISLTAPSSGSETAEATISAAPETTADKVHEAVYTWTEEHPGEPVPVIVQGSGDTKELVAAVESLGGRIVRELGIIQALDIRLPANRVGSLASHPSVAWISLDAPVVVADHDGTILPHTAVPTPAPAPDPVPAPSPTPAPVPFIDTTNLAAAYPFAVNASSVWNAATPRTGDGIGVAVIDTGISEAGHPDFIDGLGASRVVAQVAINAFTTNTNDGYGHGTHVAGIIGGDGDLLGGRYIGIAPRADIIDIKIADDSGGASLADAIAGVEWAVNNKDLYNIRVINLSLHSSVAQSYKRDPLDAAVELAWMRGIVVVVSSGNMGSVPDAVSYAPANDPFVIVVGATDDAATAVRADDTIATFSSRGVTQDGFTKPDVVAPGRRIVSTINPNSILAQTYPDRFVNGSYFRMSGTSMASPVVAGVVALMLEQNPALTPGQVKYVLANTTEPLFSEPTSKHTLADGAAFFSGTLGDTDTGLSPARNLRMNFAGKIAVIAYVLGSTDPLTGLPTVEAKATLVGLNLEAVCPGMLRSQCTLATVNWEAIKWNAIKWDLIKWDLIKWDAIKWDAIKWDAIKWDLIKWDAIKWDAIKWGAIKWDAIKWDLIKWDAIKWDAIKWDAIKWDDLGSTGVAFDSTAFDSVGFDSFADDDCGDNCQGPVVGSDVGGEVQQPDASLDSSNSGPGSGG